MKVELELHTKEEILAFNGFCQKLMSLREKADEKRQALSGNVYQRRTQKASSRSMKSY